MVSEQDLVITETELMQFFRDNKGKCFRKRTIADSLTQLRINNGSHASREELKQALWDKLRGMRLRDLPHIRRQIVESHN